MKKFLIALLTIFALAMTVGLVTACSKAEQLITLDTPQIREYDPSTGKITWAMVDHADTYEYTIDDGSGEAKTTTVSTNSATFKTQADQFTFSVKAKSNGLYQDSETKTVTFVRLSAKIELSVDEEGTVSWAPAEDATGYAVQVNGSVENITETEYSKFTSGKKNTVKVKPIRENSDTTYYFADWSEAVTVTVLGDVKVESIKYSNGKITWNKVSGATGYKITINGEDEIINDTMCEKYYDANEETFEVTVQALGDGEATFNGGVSEVKKFAYLSVVDGITVEDGYLKWNEVTGATGYQLKLNGESSSVIRCSKNTYETQLSAGRDYKVTILPTATGDNTEYFSNWCDVKTVRILPKPELTWTGVDVSGDDEVNALHWDTVPGAQGYTTKVLRPDKTDGEEQLGENVLFYSDNFDQEGEYKIQVKSNAGSQDGIYDSAYSDVFTVIRLSAPSVITERITSNKEVLDGFTVTFPEVGGAESYQLYKDSTALNINKPRPPLTVPTNLIVEENNTRDVDVAFTVRSIGKVDNGRKIVKLSSMLRENSSAAFTIKVLATPENPTIQGYEYQFDSVTSASSYNVQVSGSNNTAQNPSFNLDLVVNPGDNSVKVCAQGNGHEILPSKFSTAITVHRLFAPTGIRIATDSSDGSIQFEGDSLATSYDMTLNGSDEHLPVKVGDNIRGSIETTGTIIRMYSVRNDFNETQTIYYMTSPASPTQTFYKLETPDRIQFTNDYMSWNQPKNASMSITYSPRYKIFDASNDTIYNGEFSGQQYPLTDLNAGSYSFKIVALGDGVNCINSEAVASKEIIKLETPQLNVNTDTDEYEWDEVDSAYSYVLKIESETVSTQQHNQSPKHTYKPHYDSAGKNAQVTLQAIGDDGNTTISSKPFTYTQRIAQNSTPAFTYEYSSDYYVPDGEITVKITTKTTCSNGYVFNIGASTHKTTLQDEDNGETFKFTPNTTGQLDIYVYANGGGIDEDEVYYTDSRASETYSLYLLGYPNGGDAITLSKDGVIRWDSVANARGYIYKLKITTTDSDKTYIYEGTLDSNTANLTLKNILVKEEGTDTTTTITWDKIKTVELELQAKGNLEANTPTTHTGYVTSSVTKKSWTSNLH